MGGILMRVDNRSREMSGRRGVALVLSALLCLAFIPVIGLAIDGSIAYLMRLKVSTALDAAVVAGARSLNVGATPAAQSASAIAVATAVFNADLPTSQNWGVTNISFSPTVTSAAYMRTVAATATATIPLTFLSVLGVTSTQISVTAAAQRRNVNVMLVLDRSDSMAGVVGAMETDAAQFVNMFAAGTDHLGLIAFATSDLLVYPLSTTFETDSPNLPTLINELQTTGWTNTSQAIWDAYQALVTLNQPGALNIIVVFTDGLANTYTANFAPLISPVVSGCTGLANPLAGVIVAQQSGIGVSGLSTPTPSPMPAGLNQITYNTAAPNSVGCFWNPTPSTLVYTALLGLPAADINGNYTNGAGSYAAYKPVDLSLAGVLTPATAGLNVTNSGLNALDYAAYRIRSDSSFTPTIYCIGLGGNPGFPPDNVLMARVANDPTSPIFNSSQPQGLYVFAPSIAQLQSAFLRIATEVLRLSH
jgi:Flp pilus assembly protein TadG